jgi:mRNA-degrading endonuclease YafQ of YafQ-DinJ toxin-antitoxin module
MGRRVIADMDDRTFQKSVKKLGSSIWKRIEQTVQHLLEDRSAGVPFRSGLRVHQVRRYGKQGILEAYVAPDVRLLFSLESTREGEQLKCWDVLRHTEF